MGQLASVDVLGICECVLNIGTQISISEKFALTESTRINAPVDEVADIDLAVGTLVEDSNTLMERLRSGGAVGGRGVRSSFGEEVLRAVVNL
jgi:hypothetical protein